MRAFIVLAGLALGNLAFADCAGIRDADERAFCRAMESGQKYHCTAIADYNLRQTCLVRLGAPPSACSLVEPGQARARCEAGRSEGPRQAR